MSPTLVRNFETVEGDNPAQPELVDLGGSFKAGVGALPGTRFPGFADRGHVHRQEFRPGVAEDIARAASVRRKDVLFQAWAHGLTFYRKRTLSSDCYELYHHHFRS